MSYYPGPLGELWEGRGVQIKDGDAVRKVHVGLVDLAQAGTIDDPGPTEDDLLRMFQQIDDQVNEIKAQLQDIARRTWRGMSPEDRQLHNALHGRWSLLSEDQAQIGKRLAVLDRERAAASLSKSASGVIPALHAEHDRLVKQRKDVISGLLPMSQIEKTALNKRIDELHFRIVEMVK